MNNMKKTSNTVLYLYAGMGLIYLFIFKFLFFFLESCYFLGPKWISQQRCTVGLHQRVCHSKSAGSIIFSDQLWSKIQHVWNILLQTQCWSCISLTLKLKSLFFQSHFLQDASGAIFTIYHLTSILGGWY